MVIRPWSAKLLDDRSLSNLSGSTVQRGFVLATGCGSCEKTVIWVAGAVCLCPTEARVVLLEENRHVKPHCQEFCLADTRFTLLEHVDIYEKQAGGN